MNTSLKHEQMDINSATLLAESIINESSQVPCNENECLKKNEQTNSLWPNVYYGLGMLAFMIVPPLLPGATIRLLITGYMVLIVGIYAAAAIISAMKIWRPRNKRARLRTNRKQNL